MTDVQRAGVEHTARRLTLAIDVGGTGLKASVVDEAAQMLTERVRLPTPVGAPPQQIVELLASMVAPLAPFDRVSVGFPGVVRDGRVLTAPNLGNDLWQGFELARALDAALGKPVRIANDADLQGLAVIAGKGVEMVITLGTGFGTGLYLDGKLGPHLEIAHHPFRHGETYDQQLGNAARKAIGGARWNKRVKRAIGTLRRLDQLRSPLYRRRQRQEDRLHARSGCHHRLERRRHEGRCRALAILTSYGASPNSSVSSRTPRRRWRPSDTSSWRLASAARAKDCDITRWRPSASHRRSMREASLTAGPITVKSRRASAPTLP